MSTFNMLLILFLTWLVITFKADMDILTKMQEDRYKFASETIVEDDRKVCWYRFKDELKHKPKVVLCLHK